MENLSYEPAGPGPGWIEPAGLVPRWIESAAASESAEPRTVDPVRPARATTVTDLPKLPEEAPPPGLWAKLEAQLRREGIIR